MNLTDEDIKIIIEAIQTTYTMALTLGIKEATKPEGNIDFLNTHFSLTDENAILKTCNDEIRKNL